MVNGSSATLRARLIATVNKRWCPAQFPVIRLGVISQIDEWGMRDLAYKIEKQGRGHYTLMRYSASGRAVEELERNLKLTDGILRYLTVRCEDESAITNPAAPRIQAEEPREAAKADPTP